MTPTGATLQQLAAEIPGATVRGDATVRVRDVHHDSRSVERGDAFVVRRGQKSDGAAFVDDAALRGASALIADREIATSLPLVLVPDIDLALARASSAVWNHPSFTLDVVGITGTNGKTTTAWLLEHALTALGNPTGLLGTVEHRFGQKRWPPLHTTPEADDLTRRLASMRDAGATHVVMEVSSHAITLKRVGAIRFRVAALTNVTQDHLDFHGSFERYADAKRALFLEYGPAASVLNLDDVVGRSIAAQTLNPIGYSALGAPDAQIRVIDSTLDARSIRATVETHLGRVALVSPLVGRHNLENLLAALGVLIALEVPAEMAAGALAHAQGAPGRLERVTSGVAIGPAVFVDYAHTPDALANVLRALRDAGRGRLICVFGCGGDRDPTKRAPMGASVAEGADIAVLTTDNPRTEDPEVIAAGAERGLVESGMHRIDMAALPTEARGFVVELDRRRAIAAAIRAATPNDVVLVAGKGHEPYQEVNGVRSPFDDRDEARAALASRGR